MRTPVIDNWENGARGTSRGSEAALLTACAFPELVDAVVGIVPGNVVLCSWPPGRPAWLLDDEPLPFTSRFGPDAPAETVIPIEQFPGPMLLISAGADEVWPSSAMATALELRAARRTASSCTHLTYPTAGHDLARFLMDDPRPPRARAARDALGEPDRLAPGTPAVRASITMWTCPTSGSRCSSS